MSLMRDCYFQDNHVTSRDISVKKSANKKLWMWTYQDASGIRMPVKLLMFFMFN